jgi:hypothetical protein
MVAGLVIIIIDTLLVGVVLELVVENECVDEMQMFGGVNVVTKDENSAHNCCRRLAEIILRWRMVVDQTKSSGS